jgi:phosphoenolpyruvate synthase/pyruvate phosphate dikinase
MHYISLLKDAHQYDSTSVGGKAVNLSRLICAGLPVPQGFLVFASAYEKYISENSLQAEIERLAQTVSLTDPASAEQAALAI